MARNVNVWLTNWHWTGKTVPTPQAEVDIRIQWLNDAGEQKEYTQTVRFPNVLVDVPPLQLKQYLNKLLYRVTRKKLGIDLDPEYEP